LGGRRRCCCQRKKLLKTNAEASLCERTAPRRWTDTEKDSITLTDGGGSVADVRAAVVARLRVRQDELVQTIFARVSGEAFDRAGEDDAEYLEGLRAAVAVALEYVLEGTERGEEGAAQVPALAVEQARRAARVGVPLDTVLRRYAAGQRLLSDFVITEAGSLPMQALRATLDLQGLLVERLMATVSAEYKREARRAGRSPEQRRAERVKRLLDGEVIERPELDYELGAWHLGVIATGAGAVPAVRELADSMDRRCLSVPQGERSVWAWFGGRDKLAFADIESAIGMGLGGRGSHSLVLALGESAQGIDGWRMTHRQAQAALLVALRRGGRERVSLTRYADVALLAAALKDEMLSRVLIDIYLSPLEDSRDAGAVLLKTLSAYFAAERNATSAAAALGVVRSTVESRLRVVETCLGRTLHARLAELEVALRLVELDDC
jgi:hypothetical protein